MFNLSPERTNRMHLTELIFVGLLYLIGAAVTIWLIAAIILFIGAYFNKDGLKSPTHVLGSLEHIKQRDWYNVFWKGGIRVLVFDVDNTLCPTYTTLPEWAIKLIKYLHGMDFDVWLASKSNPNMAIIEEQIRGYANIYWPEQHDGIKKPSTEFFNFFMITGQKVAFIGDKLTDMGRIEMKSPELAYSVLVNPIGKDLYGENSFMLRRARERCTLHGWRIKRAHDRGQFKFVG